MQPKRAAVLFARVGGRRYGAASGGEKIVERSPERGLYYIAKLCTPQSSPSPDLIDRFAHPHSRPTPMRIKDDLADGARDITRLEEPDMNTNAGAVLATRLGASACNGRRDSGKGCA